MKIGWMGKHFFIRDGIRFWNHYPPDNGKSVEGYYYHYRSLCGRDTFVLEEKKKVIGELKQKNPCLRCLLILARQESLC